MPIVDLRPFGTKPAPLGTQPIGPLPSWPSLPLDKPLDPEQEAIRAGCEFHRLTARLDDAAVERVKDYLRRRFAESNDE